MNGYIYKITNLINGHSYIGQTIQKPSDRWAAHCRAGHSSAEQNMAIKLAIKKYGKQNFKFEVIEECPKELLDDREIFFIKKFDTYRNGYNSTTGGQNQGSTMKLLAFSSEIINLYNEGNSLAKIAKLYNVDKGTIKHTLVRNNVPLRKRTPRKYNDDLIQTIKKDLEFLTTSEVARKYGVSISYVSQLKTGKRRI